MQLERTPFDALDVQALGLSASAGYAPIPCYGAYAQQAVSRCFERTP